MSAFPRALATAQLIGCAIGLTYNGADPVFGPVLFVIGLLAVGLWFAAGDDL